MTPEYQAQLDWVILGEFKPEQYQGEERIRYENAANQINKQWDNQESYQWP